MLVVLSNASRLKARNVYTQPSRSLTCWNSQRVIRFTTRSKHVELRATSASKIVARQDMANWPDVIVTLELTAGHSFHDEKQTDQVVCNASQQGCGAAGQGELARCDCPSHSGLSCQSGLPRHAQATKSGNSTCCRMR